MNKFFYLLGCEPGNIWGRLEPRPRKEDFSRALRAEIHDPLWLLTRQWQFGEFKASDSGSAIFAKTAISTGMFAAYSSSGKVWSFYDPSVPLEKRVEALPIRFDYKTRAFTGRQWIRTLDRVGATFKEDPPYVQGMYASVFISAFPIISPVIQSTDKASTMVQKANVLSNVDTAQFLAAVVNRVPDGVTIFQQLAKDGLFSSIVVESIPDEHRGILSSASQMFQHWFESVYGISSDIDPAWVPERIEYRFSCALPGEKESQVTLDASDCYRNKLDWYSFDVVPPAGSADVPKSIDVNKVTAIATEVRFPGMPNSRFWEFEDASVDLGNISADPSEIAKDVLVEFATLYGNDWLIIPLRVPVGSLTEVKGILVTDVFGVRTLIQPAGQGQSEDWMQWNLFGLTRRDDPSGSLLDRRLLIAPALADSLEGEPMEEVHFLRDEVADLVWAVESRVPDWLGGGRDGQCAANASSAFLGELDQSSGSPEAHPSGKLHYELANTVPANWIPFIPVHVFPKAREIQMQRASMPLKFRTEWLRVRPLTTILRPGINSDTQALITDNEGNLAPYFIAEEEISRTGTSVQTAYQRARWVNGKTFLWLGRKRGTPSERIDSGLRFDCLRQ
jgi:hypothetical protein